MGHLSNHFRADDLTEIAWREAVRRRDEAAFYVREDAALVARLEADCFASVDGLAMARASLARHEARLAAAEIAVTEAGERMRERSIPFHDGSAPARLSEAEEADAFAAVQAVLAGLDAANDAGVPAPTVLIFAVRGFMAEAR